MFAMSPVRAQRASTHLRVVPSPTDEPASSTGRDDSARVDGALAARMADRDRLLTVVGGDQAAAEALYDEYVPAVHATLVRILGARTQEHPDLVQRVFVELVRSAPSFRGECSLGTWLSRIAAHVGLNALRSVRRHRAVFSPDEAPEMGAAPPVSPETKDALDRALLRLAPEKAEAVLLHDLLGHDLAEMAAISGISVAAAQSRLVRGRSELRAHLTALLELSP
jgi:RNA polymerase sigma-70 factor, ECF subfamily